MPDPNEIIADISRRFAAEMPQRLAALRQAAASPAPEARAALRRIAHDIAGLAGSIGFPRTGAAASALESLVYPARSETTPDTQAAVEAIARAFEEEQRAQSAASTSAGHTAS
ncbi:MAG: Hpt domain-containing protein [Rhodovarius sp.]|nr:Hpt domain-containing protein [Rhodovarius sp.]MCX7931510.1 Hpt domain-containing protein [Rhodovarius sp.]MDW8313928.1 Hpt domain-containing protein [Rhodovarius sp.]